MNKDAKNKFEYILFDPITNKKTPCSIKELQRDLGVSLNDINHMLIDRIPIKNKGYFLRVNMTGEDTNDFLSKIYPNEAWETLERGHGKYEVSNYGRVRHKTKTPTTSPCLTHHLKKTDKKHYVIIQEDNKQVRLYVDELVVYHFLNKGKLLEDEQVIHLDGNNENNYYKNLKVSKFSFDKQLQLMKEAHERSVLEDDTLYPNERWKPLNRTNSPYQISDYGRIRKLKDNGEFYYLKQIRKGRSNILQVMVSANGNKSYESVSRLVAEHFLDDFSPDKSIFHVDLNKDNNHYSNLQCVDKSKLGKMTARMSRNLPKVVCTNILTGEEVGVYNSAREAGKILGISRQAVSDNLNGKSKLVSKKYKFRYQEQCK